MIEDIEAIYACFAGLAVSPSKKEKVQNAYKEEAVVLNSDKEKVSTLKDRSVSEIGEPKFK